LALSASSAYQLISHFDQLIVSLSILLQWLITATQISWRLKQAAAALELGVATSAYKVANMTISYYCTISLLHISIHVRETMCWWLAVSKKKM
jgi:hypothetical protein